MVNRLKELRLESKLTLKELAEKLNMTSSSISMMENGQRGISVENLKLFCEFFDVTSDYFLYITNDKPIKKNVNSSNNSSFILSLNNIQGQLSEEDKDLLIHLAIKLANNKN